MDEEARQPLQGKKLLVAEDEAVIALDYAGMLSSAGAQIGTARSAAEVIDYVSRYRVDAVVLDFVLADGNSSALQMVLAERRIPFVVVSGYPAVLVRESQDQHVLHKPITADHLCAAVLAVCDGKS
ncbi:MAG: response regulator [Sphingomonadales bacterium]|nr:response regulator [Sphingomonadales bacterium]